MISPLTRSLRIWRKAMLLNFTLYVAGRLDFLTFIPAKVLRMGFFFLFATSVFAPGTTVAGYTSQEALFFFAFMNLMDVMLQLFYRGLTDHPRIVKNGDFDFILTKPVDPLWYCTFRVLDFIDLVTLPFVFGFLGYVVVQWPGSADMATWLVVGLLVLCGFLIGLCLNILIATLSFWTTDIMNAHWIYRDLVYVARFPPEVFPETVRAIFTYVVPILVIVSFPTKALLQRLSLGDFLWTFVVLGVIMFVTRALWNVGVRRYTSASS